METIYTPDSADLGWAIDRYREGADWGDVIHLLAARGVAGRFVTFDRAIEGDAGSYTPLSIETLT